MQIKKSLSILAAVTVVAVSAPSFAELKGKEICEKMKTCVIESFDGQEVPEQMKQILLQQLDQQCLAEFDKKKDEIINAGLKGEANACADSMIEVPCETLMSPENGVHETEACATFKTAAEKAGVSVE